MLCPRCGRRRVANQLTVSGPAGHGAARTCFQCAECEGLPNAPDGVDLGLFRGRIDLWPGPMLGLAAPSDDAPATP